jgi:hypothetical protein
MHRVRPPRRILTSRERVATFEKDRVCAAQSCATRLSVYNPTCYCALHAPQAVSRDPLHQH